MEEITYTFELPLHTMVSRQFKAFVKELGSPAEHNCMFKFFRGILEISSSTMLNANGTLGRTATIIPQQVDLTQISKFASKFNVSMSMSKDDRDIFIQIVDDIPTEALLKVTIAPKTLASKMALSNFFSVIEA